MPGPLSNLRGLSDRQCPPEAKGLSDRPLETFGFGVK